MKTLLQLGPKDDGRLVTEEEWETASLKEGYRYEIIDGILLVSPTAELPHEVMARWLGRIWDAYSNKHPAIVNFLTGVARIHIPGHAQMTVPQPDLAAYQNFPFDVPRRQLRWRQVSPVFVAEIVSERSAHKDLIRNVDLYMEVRSIREYWILDPRGSQDQMLVYRRRGSRWQRVIEVNEGDTYTSRLFPGLEVTLTGE